LGFRFRQCSKKNFMRLLVFTAYLLIVSVVANTSLAQNNNTISTTSKEKLTEFMNMRFGMFIHWGPVTLRGTEIGWSRGHEVATDDYDNLYKEFNPILFDAEAWVKTAKAAGMKYLTITSKHHDGFCLWPTAYSAYNISATPYKKDIVGQLAKACKSNGIRFCMYFTILDWHDPDYPLHNDGKAEDPNGNMSKFLNTIKNELKEIITNYDPYMLWFDGQWESPWTDEMGAEIYRYVKSLNKDIIMNNRLGKEMTAVDKNKTVDYSKMIGDYDTPEQQIGSMNMNFPWETCMTIATQWAWKPNDKIKSLQQCVYSLIRAASGNGNFLFNVGPMPDGRIEQRQKNVLEQMGNWLSIFSESIYETNGGPYLPNEIYTATRKGNKVYVHILDTAVKQLSLPLLPGVKIRKTSLINGGMVSFSQTKTLYNFSLSFNPANSISNVLVLEIDKTAIDIPLIETTTGKID